MFRPRITFSRCSVGTAGSARGLARGKLNNLRSDFLLPHDSLARLQRGELALDLALRRSHCFHAGLVLRRECMERRIAELSVHVIRCKFDQKRFGCQAQQWRVGAGRKGKGRQVKRKQLAPFDTNAMARLPFAEDGVEAVDSRAVASTPTSNMRGSLTIW